MGLGYTALSEAFYYSIFSILIWLRPFYPSSASVSAAASVSAMASVSAVSSVFFLFAIPPFTFLNIPLVSAALVVCAATVVSALEDDGNG